MNGRWSYGTWCPTPQSASAWTGSACTLRRRGPGSTPVTKPGGCGTLRRRCGSWTRPPNRSGPACCSTSAAGMPPGKSIWTWCSTANREAVRLVPAEPPSPARARVLVGYGRALHIQAGRYEEAAAAHEQALTAARRARSQPDIARAMAGLGYLRAVTGEVDAGIALLREAYASAERSAGGTAMAESKEFPGDDEWRLARVVHLLLSDVLLKTGRLAGGRRRGGAGLGDAAASRPGRPSQRMRSARLRGGGPVRAGPLGPGGADQRAAGTPARQLRQRDTSGETSRAGSRPRRA